MKFPSLTDIAWAAGVFCGEGYFGLHRTDHSLSVRISITQSSFDLQPPEMLVRFRDIFDAGKIYEEKSTFRAVGSRKVFQYYLHGVENCQAIATMMWRWLTPDKQRQVIKAMVRKREHHAKRQQETAQFHGNGRSQSRSRKASGSVAKSG